MIEQDDIKRAERRGYANGYAAGRRRIKLNNERERTRQERKAFLDKAFLSLLPVAMQVDGWKIGDKHVKDVHSRMELARLWAEESLKHRPVASSAR